MSRSSTYQVRLRKIVCGGVRNIDSYYVVLRSEKQPLKYISRAMRIDEDNEDELAPELDIRPTSVQLWNYDKMRLTETFQIDFRAQAAFTWTVFQDNLELTVQRTNEWEEELRNRQKGEEDEDASNPSRQPSNLPSRQPSNLATVPPQRSEVASSKIASNTPSKAASNTPSKVVSNTPSKVVSNTPSKAASNTPSKAASNTPSKVIKASQQSKRDKSSLAEPPNPKKFADSITKLPVKSPSEMKVESISLIEY